MASKRKHSEADLSDDEDEPSLGKQVLPVANLPVDFNGIPEDGMQYLFTVRRDARMLPHITRVANPYEAKEEPREPPVDDMGPNHPSLPSEDWQGVFIRRFKNFRKNVIQPTCDVRVPSQRKLIPDKKERDLWWAFLTGQPASMWNPPKKPKQPKSSRGWRGDARSASEDTTFPQTLSYSLEDGRIISASSSEMWRVTTDGVQLTGSASASTWLPTPSGTPAPPDAPDDLRGQDATGSVVDHLSPATTHPPEPTPTIMQYIDHRYALHLLMYFTHWINLHLERGSSTSPHLITEAHSRWIFVLLSKVEDYVSADETSLLRSLSRACMSLIEESRRTQNAAESFGRELSSSLSPSSPPLMDEPTCWMVLTAVIGIWGQRDLWLDAEAMVRRSPV